jgi:hypothetical protein
VSLFDRLTAPDDQRDVQPIAHERVVPSQPIGTEPGKVFVGSDLGEVDYSGEPPQAGDLITILGRPGRQMAITGQSVPSLTTPTWSPGCRCNCPTAGGVAFYMQSAARNSAILAMDGSTGLLLQLFGLADLWFGRGIAVDPQAPYHLYVLDDRRVLDKLQTEANNTPTRGYFTIVTFALSGGQYVATNYLDLTDPFPTPAIVADFPGIGLESQDRDPPNFTTQGLAVIEGDLILTMHNAPARYIAITNGVAVTHTLTQNSVPLAMGLRGQIVTLSQQPAKKSNRYAIATDGVNYQLVEFNSSDVVSRTFDLEAFPPPAQLASVCNRLLLLSTSTITLLPSTENSP